MGVGRRRSEEQCEFWVAAEDLGRGPRNVFYDKLNEVLAESDFDRELEKAVEPYYCTTGRKGLAPSVYFRMLFIGYFEDISSQRGIAWRCEDSRSLARFLGYRPGESTPDHSTLSLTRDRLPLEIHCLAFELVLAALQKHKLLKGKTIAVDATDLEANASMKSIVRRDNGDDWREYLRKLYEEETGEANPDDEELRRFDKRRKNKKVSNTDWESSSDPDSRIGKMKDGRTHLKYKAEHAVDLQTQVIVAAEVYHGDTGDTQTIEDTLYAAQTHLNEAGRIAKSKKSWRTRDTTVRIVFSVCSASQVGAPTFPNQNARHPASGRTSLRRTNGPIVATAATRSASEAVIYSEPAANKLNEVSLTPAPRAARGERGFAVWRKSRSDT